MKRVRELAASLASVIADWKATNDADYNESEGFYLMVPTVIEWARTNKVTWPEFRELDERSGQFSNRFEWDWALRRARNVDRRLLNQISENSGHALPGSALD